MFKLIRHVVLLLISNNPFSSHLHLALDLRGTITTATLFWDMINCSKFDCSKKLVDTILSTGRHHSSKCHFFVNWSNPVNLWESTGFDQFHFQSKKYQLLELQMVDKGFGKSKLLDTNYSKKMVHMYGSKVRGQVRLGQVRCTCMAVRLGQVRFGQVR